MTAVVRKIIKQLDQLSESEIKALAQEVLFRLGHIESPPLTDDGFNRAAEELFLALDLAEADEASKSR